MDPGDQSNAPPIPAVASKPGEMAPGMNRKVRTLTSMPPEIIIQIFAYLPVKARRGIDRDLFSVCLVCKLFRDLALPFIYRSIELRAPFPDDISPVVIKSLSQPNHPGVRYIQHIRLFPEETTRLGTDRHEEIDWPQGSPTMLFLGDIISKLAPGQLQSLIITPPTRQLIPALVRSGQTRIKNMTIDTDHYYSKATGWWASGLLEGSTQANHPRANVPPVEEFDAMPSTLLTQLVVSSTVSKKINQLESAEIWLGQFENDWAVFLALISTNSESLKRLLFDGSLDCRIFELGKFRKHFNDEFVHESFKRVFDRYFQEDIELPAAKSLEKIIFNSVSWILMFLPYLNRVVDTTNLRALYFFHCSSGQPRIDDSPVPAALAGAAEFLSLTELVLHECGDMVDIERCLISLSPILRLLHIKYSGWDGFSRYPSTSVLERHADSLDWLWLEINKTASVVLLPMAAVTPETGFEAAQTVSWEFVVKNLKLREFCCCLPKAAVDSMRNADLLFPRMQLLRNLGDGFDITDMLVRSAAKNFEVFQEENISASGTASFVYQSGLGLDIGVKTPSQENIVAFNYDHRKDPGNRTRISKLTTEEAKFYHHELRMLDWETSAKDLWRSG